MDFIENCFQLTLHTHKFSSSLFPNGLNVLVRSICMAFILWTAARRVSSFTDEQMTSGTEKNESKKILCCNLLIFSGVSPYSARYIGVPMNSIGKKEKKSAIAMKLIT